MSPGINLLFSPLDIALVSNKLLVIDWGGYDITGKLLIVNMTVVVGVIVQGQ